MAYTTFGTLGRMLLSFIFIFGGIQKLLNWGETEQTFILALSRWLDHSGTAAWIRSLMDGLMQSPDIWLGLLTIAQLLGGILLFLGLRVGFASILLLIFLLITNVIYHSFWLFQDAEKQLQLILFLYNISILGGIFLALDGSCRPCASGRESD
jgi:putative oxidoreductase